MFTPGKGQPLSLTGEERKAKVLDLAAHWCALDFNPQSRAIMQEWVAAQDFSRLEKALLPRINFGTSGLRNQMAPGYAYINFVTVQQAAQGVCKYMISHFGLEECQRKGVVFGYDSRYNSKAYAELSAAVFLSMGVPVHLFTRFVITPLVPYTILKKGLAGGVMVTASHNPKQDNGYKVYWTNGAQVINPHDVGISGEILNNLDLWPLAGHPTCDFSAVIGNCLPDITDEMIDAYVTDSAQKYSKRGVRNASAERAVYTPMHGVGLEIFLKIMAKYHFPEPIIVTEQKDPDPEFPTVPFPNPEEGQGALHLAMQTAEAAGLKFIIANDPDADRLAIAERQTDGSWTIFTGDEIAILLAAWIIEHRDSAQKGAIVASTVSSKLVKAICERHGIRFEEVLTGFKWIINKCLDLEVEGFQSLFAFEEAIGFCVGDLVKDKDGVTAGAVFYEMYNEKCVSTGTTLVQLLETLKQTYGFYMTKNKYFICYEPAVIKQVFASIRNQGEYPSHCGRFPIRFIRDLTVGYDNSQPDKKPVLPVTPSTEMITFTFENGAIVTLRTSGTEPKIKYYCEFNSESKLEAVSELNALVESVISDLLQPTRFGLQWPS